MIDLSFIIRNPYSNRFNIIKHWHGRTPFANKFWEFQIDRTPNLLAFELRFTTRQDHAGLWFGISLFGYDVIFNWYDSRHWDTVKNQWESKNG